MTKGPGNSQLLLQALESDDRNLLDDLFTQQGVTSEKRWIKKWTEGYVAGEVDDERVSMHRIRFSVIAAIAFLVRSLDASQAASLLDALALFALEKPTRQPIYFRWVASILDRFRGQEKFIDEAGTAIQVLQDYAELRCAEKHRIEMLLAELESLENLTLRNVQEESLNRAHYDHLVGSAYAMEPLIKHTIT